MSIPATVPYTTALLTAELTNDPAGMGYAAAKAIGDQHTADLLNSLSSPGATQVWRTMIQASEVLRTIISADFLALTALQLQQLSAMLTLGTFDASTAAVNTQSTFASIFTGKTNTLTAFNTMAQTLGSRAQALWGYGTQITITALNVANALGRSS